MAGMTLCLCLLMCCTLVSATFKLYKNTVPENDYYIPGDVNVGMINAMASTSKVPCDKKAREEIQGANAVLFRINEINQDSSILPNISIGLVILNDCWHKPTALYRATKLIPVKRCAGDDCCNQPVEYATNPTVRGCYNVTAMVVSYSSSLSEPQSRLLSMYKIPHISTGATADVLSDRYQYKYFNRIVPADKLQIQAIVGTLVAFNWTYISLIGTTSTYSRDGVAEIRMLAQKHGICIAYAVELLPNFDDGDYDNVIRRLRIQSKAKVVVMLTENIPGVFKAVIRKQAQGEFIFFAGDKFAFRQDGVHPGAGINGLQTYFNEEGSRRFERFEKYYKALSPWAHMDAPDIFLEHTPEDLKCSMELEKGKNNSCVNYEKIEDLPNFRLREAYLDKVDAINIILFALDAMIHAKCPSAFKDKSILEGCIDGERLLAFIRNTTIQGYSNFIRVGANGDAINDYIIWQWQADGKGGFKYVDVGRWGLTEGVLYEYPGKLKWLSVDETLIDTPESVCAKPCKQGEFHIQGELKCCWECRKCRVNEKIEDNFKSCTQCPNFTWPDQDNFTTCEPIPPVYIKWLDRIALGLLGLSVIGLLSTFAITYVLLKYRQKKVVEGSSIEQIMTVVVALYLSYSTAILYIAKPIYALCLVQYYSFHLSCTLMFVPLLLKTTRLYRIEKCEQSVKFVTSKALRLFSLTQISIVVLILVVCTIVFYDDLGHKLQMPEDTVPDVELVCKSSSETLLIPLSYNLLLLLMCAVYGFLTRKLTDNFNETWYIFISVSTTLFVWLAFLPTYFMAHSAYHKSALLGLAVILNAAVTEIFLFAPKIYAIYYIKEDNIKVTNFEGAANKGGPAQK